MCNMVYISTTSDDDLSAGDTDRISFVPAAGAWHEAKVPRLEYPNRWFVAWMGGCSCGFRHLSSTVMDFGEPEDWCPEDEEDIENTRHLYRVIMGVLAAGHSVDLIDFWARDRPEEPAEINSLDVVLSEIPEASFRLFENYHFRFAPGMRTVSACQG